MTEKTDAEPPFLREAYMQAQAVVAGRDADIHRLKESLRKIIDLCDGSSYRLGTKVYEVATEALGVFRKPECHPEVQPVEQDEWFASLPQELADSVRLLDLRAPRPTR